MELPDWSTLEACQPIVSLSDRPGPALPLCRLGQPCQPGQPPTASPSQPPASAPERGLERRLLAMTCCSLSWPPRRQTLSSATWPNAIMGNLESCPPFLAHAAMTGLCHAAVLLHDRFPECMPRRVSLACVRIGYRAAAVAWLMTCLTGSVGSRAMSNEQNSLNATARQFLRSGRKLSHIVDEGDIGTKFVMSLSTPTPTTKPPAPLRAGMPGFRLVLRLAMSALQWPAALARQSPPVNEQEGCSITWPQ